MNLKVGADPEFFLFDKKLGHIVSAHGLVPGTKVNPHPMSNGAAIQLDGTAVEFNIAPATSGSEFASNIEKALKDIEAIVDTKRYQFKFVPVVNYNRDYFEKHVPPSSKELGCDPDYNAYTGKQNPIHKPGPFTRTGSGHIHVGFNDVEDAKDPGHIEDCCALAKSFDYMILPYKPLWDNDCSRTLTYGQAGNFRPKKYGFEYRTLSNAWLNYPDLWPWLYEASNAVVQIMLNESPKKLRNTVFIEGGYLNANGGITSAHLKNNGHYSKPLRKFEEYGVKTPKFFYKAA